MYETHRKVKFNGGTYWLNGPTEMGCFNLSPLDHFSESGELLANPFTCVSYAIVVRGEVVRHGITIGYESDIKDVWTEANEEQVEGRFKRT